MYSINLGLIAIKLLCFTKCDYTLYFMNKQNVLIICIILLTHIIYTQTTTQKFKIDGIRREKNLIEKCQLNWINFFFFF